MEIYKHSETPNKSRGTNKKIFLTVHHTATGKGTAEGVFKRFVTPMGKRSVSCHYIIDEHGHIYKIGHDDNKLRHCGTSSYKTLDGNTFYNLNNYSIGIEFIGPLPGFTEKQKKVGRSLITELIKKHGIGVENILRHKDIAPGRKVDIDDSLWNETFDSFQDYQNSFLDTNEKYPMTEQQKEVLIINQMNLNSVLYNIVQDEELKELMSKMNTIYRKKGFDNK